MNGLMSVRKKKHTHRKGGGMNIHEREDTTISRSIAAGLSIEPVPKEERENKKKKNKKRMRACRR